MSNKIKTIKLYVKEKQIELKKNLKLVKQSLKNEDPRILLAPTIYNKNFSFVHETRDDTLDIPEGLFTEEAKEALNFLYKNNLFDMSFEELKEMVDGFARIKITHNVSNKDFEAYAIIYNRLLKKTSSEEFDKAYALLNNKANVPIDIANVPVDTANALIDKTSNAFIDNKVNSFIENPTREETRQLIDQVMNNCSCPDQEVLGKIILRPRPRIREVAETITAPCPKIKEVAEIVTTPREEIKEVVETIAAPLVRSANTARSSLNALKNSVFSFDLNCLKKAYSPMSLPDNFFGEGFFFFAKYVPKLRFVETTVENFVFSG